MFVIQGLCPLHINVLCMSVTSLCPARSDDLEEKNQPSKEGTCHLGTAVGGHFQPATTPNKRCTINPIHSQSQN
eukprot:1140732-Pelagomonas_calceolata.AAC.3